MNHSSELIYHISILPFIQKVVQRVVFSFYWMTDTEGGLVFQSQWAPGQNGDIVPATVIL